VYKNPIAYCLESFNSMCDQGRIFYVKKIQRPHDDSIKLNEKVRQVPFVFLMLNNTMLRRIKYSIFF